MRECVEVKEEARRLVDKESSYYKNKHHETKQDMTRYDNR